MVNTLNIGSECVKCVGRTHPNDTGSRPLDPEQTDIARPSGSTAPSAFPVAPSSIFAPSSDAWSP